MATATTAVLAAAALSLLGCASSAPSGAESEAAAPDTARVETTTPIEITGIEVRDAAPGTQVIVRAGGPLVWTQYRDAEGRLVLELPNTTRADGREPAVPGGGLLSQIRVEDLPNADRPLTRLTLRTAQDAEHELVAEDGTLLLTLTPVAAEAWATAELPEAEDLAPAEAAVATPTPGLPPAEEAADATAAEPAPAVATAGPEPMAPAAVPTPVGTPDEPWVAPAPSGVAATRLRAVEIAGTPGSPVVRILGDGEFAYSTFQLSDPARFVLDLPGVVNLAGATAYEAYREPLDRVRVAQFTGHPSPVSRVVLDLDAPVVPTVTRTVDGLEISFGAGAVAEVPPAPEAAPEPQVVAALEEADADAAPAPVEEAYEPAPAPIETAPAPVWEEPAVAAAPQPEAEPATIAEAAPPAPSAPRAPANDVALFEAMDVQDVVITEDEVEQAPDQFAAKEVGGEERQYVGEPISFSLRDADIKEVLRTFAKISGLNIVVQPGVGGAVTVELEQVPWDQALEVILRTNNLWYDIEGNIMRIAPAAQLAREAQEEAARRQAQQLAVPLQRIMKRVSYAQAGQIASLLRTGILSARGTVVVDGRTNTLIIQELPEYMTSVLSIIDQVDVPEPQVMIEARIVETTKRFSRSLGIAWGIDGVASAATGNSTGLVFPNSIEGDAAVSLLTGGANGLINLSLGNVLDTFNLDATLQAAESEGLVNILSAPKIATLNNEAASIQSGLQIPVQTVSNNTVTVQFVNATLRLNVTPHVTAEGTVLMDINIQKREPQLAFAVAGAANAPIATKEARTRVIVRDGGTTVIGGIYEVSTDQGQDRVPGLANIPIIGNLFKNRRRSDENEELLIFITPRVIKL